MPTSSPVYRHGAIQFRLDHPVVPLRSTSMPWRERVSRAKLAGEFIKDDLDAWQGLDTCLVGEAALRVAGVTTFTQTFTDAFMAIGDCAADKLGLGAASGHVLQLELLGAIRRDDIALVEHALDTIEDAALEVKRTLGA
jgi:hypothetical protein